jgi:sulfite reductase alpha subunit-like flavoprotein
MNTKNSKMNGKDEENPRKVFSYRIASHLQGLPCSISIEEVTEPSEFTLLSNPYKSAIISFETLEFPEISKTILTLKLSKVKYEIGDCISLYPNNDPQNVDRLLQHLHYNPEQTIKLTDTKSIIGNITVTQNPNSTGSVSHFLQNRPISIKTIFLNVLDLHGCPSQIFLKMLSHFCTDLDEKDQLQALGSNLSDYKEIIVKNHKNYFQLFLEYSSCLPPLSHFLQYCDVMKERFYSISSSPRVHADSMELSLSLVSAELPSSRTFQGLCSHWLHSKCLSEDNLIEFQIKQSEQFVHLCNLNKKFPLLVICHGTSMFFM